MSDLAIRVVNLGKQYRIGGPPTANRTFREAIMDSLTAPIRWMRGERRSIETFWALEDVSFEVKQGEAVGIIGRNGAGKSTLLKVLSRITRPTKGRVELYGRVASLLEVGTGFHPELTGRDNIYLNGAILGMSQGEIARKFDEIVDFSGVEKFLDTPVKHYSSGMYVRLAFAVAAHLEPEIMVVDEVLAVGDAEFQKKCLGKMNDVTKQGRTVLLVSHNMGAINQFSTKTVLIRNGKLVNFGPTNEVVSYYLSGDQNKNSDFRFDPNKDPNSPISFTRLTVIKKNNEMGEEIGVNDGFKIRIEILAKRLVENADIGIRVDNQIGYPVFTSALSETTKSLTHFEKGVYKYLIEFPPTFLTPGVFRITFAIHTPQVKIHDFLDNLVTIEILETGRHPLWQYAGNNYGDVFVNLPWRLEESRKS